MGFPFFFLGGGGGGVPPQFAGGAGGGEDMEWIYEGLKVKMQSITTSDTSFPCGPTSWGPNGVTAVNKHSARLCSLKRLTSDSQGTRHAIKLRCVETDDGWLMLRI